MKSVSVRRLPGPEWTNVPKARILGDGEPPNADELIYMMKEIAGRSEGPKHISLSFQCPEPKGGKVDWEQEGLFNGLSGRILGPGEGGSLLCDLLDLWMFCSPILESRVEIESGAKVFGEVFRPFLGAPLLAGLIPAENELTFWYETPEPVDFPEDLTHGQVGAKPLFTLSASTDLGKEYLNMYIARIFHQDLIDRSCVQPNGLKIFG